VENLELSVVIPAHKESLTIRHALERLLAVLEEHRVHAELVVVLDGPDDVALVEVEKIKKENIRVSVLSTNQGKGAALRVGCIGLDSEFTAFLDADLDIDPLSLIHCLNILKNSDDPVVVCAYGSKFNKESQVDYPILRKFGSRLFRQGIRILFGFDCHDTQTGVKVFRTKELISAVNLTRECRFIFDVELFWILSEMGWRFTDAPVILNYNYSSTISVTSVIRMIIDTLRLKVSVMSSGRLDVGSDF
jgi:glycosyltransferase involved in cell wall biosynthesis